MINYSVRQLAIRLERLAIVKSQQGQHEMAAMLWNKIDSLNCAEVSDLVGQIDQIDSEIIYTLQRPAYGAADVDQLNTRLNELCKDRKHTVAKLEHRAEWLAKSLHNNWLNAQQQAVDAAQDCIAAACRKH